MIFFLHGFGMSRYSYTTLIEELVSHGFIVASLDSPHSGLTITPEGQIITTLYDGKPVAKCENMAKDVRFIYDWLQGPNLEHLSGLTSHIDFSRASVVGHSLGGAAALETCRTDARFLAAIDLDGDPFGKVEEEGLAKPTLVLLNQPLVKEEDFTDTAAKAKWTAMGNERKEMWEKIFQKKANVPAYAFRITATNHFTFSDFPFVTTQYDKQAKPGRTLNKERSLSIICTYIRVFLDRYVSGDTADDLRELVKKFPETNLHATIVK